MWKLTLAKVLAAAVVLAVARATKEAAQKAAGVDDTEAACQAAQVAEDREEGLAVEI